MPDLTTLRIGPLVLPSPFIAGPMAEVSHPALRDLIRRFGGAGALFTEMLDGRILLRETPGKSPWLADSGESPPLFYQVLVSDPLVAEKDAVRLEEMGAKAMDINMGCSAPLIRKQGAGIMLMKDPGRALEIVSATRSRFPGALTVKIRTGFEDDIDKTVDFCRRLENAGIDAVFYHPRRADQKLKGRARWPFVPLLKKALRIPVIGNGDIRSPRKALSRLAESGADGVMISRYTATCPWVFRQIRDAVEGRTSLFQPHKTDLWLEFFDRTASLYPEEEARVRIARWNAYFAQHFAFGHRFQLAVRNAPTLNEARRLGLEFLERNA